jgi:hypothetical protein
MKMLSPVLHGFIKKTYPVLKSLWFLAIVILVMIGRTLPFPLLIALTAIAISIPLIREFFSKKALDERQVQIGHLSSHFAYFTYTFLLIFIIIYELIKNGQLTTLAFVILLLVPLLFKVILGLIQKYGASAGITGNLLLLLRGLIPINKADERQNAIGNLSSHIAFYVFLILTLTVIFIQFIKPGQNPSNLWYMLLIELFTSFLMTYGPVTGGQFIGFTIVGIFFLFIVLSHGLSLGTVMESIPFLIIFTFLILAGRFPQIAGGMLVVVALGLVWFFHAWRNMDFFGRILMFSVLPIPVLISGVALLFHQTKKI